MKSGTVSDPELEEKFRQAAIARKKKPAPDRTAEAAKPVMEESKARVACANRKPRSERAIARRVVESHRSELDDLESDAVDSHLSELIKQGLAVYDSATDDSSPERKPRGAQSGRFRLKSLSLQPDKRVPDRKAKLRAALVSEDEDEL